MISVRRSTPSLSGLDNKEAAPSRANFVRFPRCANFAKFFGQILRRGQKQKGRTPAGAPFANQAPGSLRKPWIR